MKKNTLILTGVLVAGIASFAAFTAFGNNNDMMEKDKMMNEPKAEMSKDMMAETDDMDKDMKDSDKMMDDKDMSSDDMKSDMAMDDSKNMEGDMKKDGMESEHSGVEDKDMMEKMNDGEMAPDFSLKDLDGNTVSLADFKGKKLYVKFWASWCPICLSGLDEIDQLAGMDKDYEIISIVSPGYNGEKKTDDFKEWFKTKNTKNLTVLLDEGGEVTRKFGVRGYPTSAFIGSDNVLVRVFPGHVSKDVIKQQFMGIK